MAINRTGTKITIPASKSDVVNGAGWLSDQWWSNGGYEFTHKRKRFWRLCLEKTGMLNVGHNAVITKKDRKFVGIIWTDHATTGHSEKELAETVKRRCFK